MGHFMVRNCHLISQCIHGRVHVSRFLNAYIGQFMVSSCLFSLPQILFNLNMIHPFSLIIIMLLLTI